mgnify:FL=1
MKNKILKLLQSKINIHKIQIYDLSDKHKNHTKSNTGGHYKIHVISDDFINMTLLNRHQIIYSILGEMLKNEIHALSIKTQTITESGK